eukprot:7386482-Prymnesium_polylepis.2
MGTRGRRALCLSTPTMLGVRCRALGRPWSASSAARGQKRARAASCRCRRRRRGMFAASRLPKCIPRPSVSRR